MKISVSLIVKNESSCLARCLESVRAADEIVICDTGSTDDTVDIARRYTDLVFEDFAWNDSFCDARNHALAKCSGDWVLSIDADETLAPGGIEKIRTAAAVAELLGHSTIKVLLQNDTGRERTMFPRVLRRHAKVFWVGDYHECPSDIVGTDSDAVITYGHSVAHSLDPDRGIRILTKSVLKNPEATRELYYLAREYWYRNNFQRAAEVYQTYLARATWLPEKADAYLMLARCYWHLQRGEDARRACLMAININANFKEALLFMGELSWPANRERWEDFARHATNEGVLFVRDV